MDRSIKQLTREMQPFNDLKDSLAALGVSLYDADGNFKSTRDLFGDLAQAMDFSDPGFSLHMYDKNTGEETMILNSATTATTTSASNTYNCTNTNPNTVSSWTINLPDTGIISNYNGIPLDEYIKSIVKEETKKEKKDTMLGFGKFQFGPIKDNSVALSIRGVAVKNAAGEYVCYDENTNEIVSVDGLTFDSSDMIYAMPVAIKDVRPCDLIIHNKHYCYVAEVDDTTLRVIDIPDGTIKDILPTKSPFGFNFITKVTSFMNCGNADENNPFGNNFMMFMLMQDGKLDKSMLPFLLMQQNNSGNMDMNSMLPWFLLQSKS
jgi:hypothetical protein